MNSNLYAHFEQRFHQRPQGVCLRDGDREVTYEALMIEAGRYAHALRALGARPGDRIAVQVEKSPEAVFLYLGCLRVGCVFLPMNPAYQQGEVEHLLRDAEPRVFVVDPALLERARAAAQNTSGPGVVTLGDDGRGDLVDLAAQQPADFPTESREPQDLAAILYTSGTTGKPKGAMLTHANLLSNVTVLHEYWQFQPDDVLVHVLPIYHIHGLFVALHCAFWNTSPIWFERRFDPARTIDLFARSSVFMGVPTHYVRLLSQSKLSTETCSNMRLFISGSAPLLPDTFRSFSERTGHTILERYGMTECGMLVSNPYDGERRCGTVGKPLPGVSLRIVDAQGRPVAPGEVGAIEVKGPNVFAGYWRMPGKTAEEHTADGYFKTGDLGTLSEDGYVSIVGRGKDLIISGGLNVYPKEVEEVIDALPGVVESAVIGLPDPDFGEAVTAVVVLRPEAREQWNEAALIATLKQQLAGYKVPKAVHFVDDLPRNVMGKVQKNVLRATYGQ